MAWTHWPALCPSGDLLALRGWMPGPCLSQSESSACVHVGGIYYFQFSRIAYVLSVSQTQKTNGFF